MWTSQCYLDQSDKHRFILQLSGSVSTTMHVCMMPVWQVGENVVQGAHSTCGSVWRP